MRYKCNTTLKHNIKEHNYSWVHSSYSTRYRLQLSTALLNINEKKNHTLCTRQCIHKINPHTRYSLTHCLLQGTYNNQYQLLLTTSKRNHITSNIITLNNTITVESCTQHIFNSTQQYSNQLSPRPCITTTAIQHTLVYTFQILYK